MYAYYYLEKKIPWLPARFPGNRWIKKPNQAQRLLERRWWFMVAAAKAVWPRIDWNKHG